MALDKSSAQMDAPPRYQGKIELDVGGVITRDKSLSSIDFKFDDSSIQEDEIDLREFFSVIWRNKLLIAGLSALFAVVAIVYARSLPNIYRSEVLLAPAEENSGGGIAGLAGQLGGLATLAGVSLGGQKADKTVFAIEVLKSREFVTQFIQHHNLLVPLIAAKGWSFETKELVIDDNIYDSERNVWVRKVSPPLSIEPSMHEAYEAFRKILTVNVDKQTNFVSFSIEFYSPLLAKEWVDLLVEDVNKVIKSRDVAEAERSIQYLKEQISKTSIADMQTVFYQLIEEQTKTIMFAEVRDEYVFKTIDRAVVAESKAKPQRMLIVMLGAIVGSILAVVVVFIRHILVAKNKKEG